MSSTAHRRRLGRRARRRRRDQHKGLQRALIIVFAFAPFLFVTLALGAATTTLHLAAALEQEVPLLEEQEQTELAETSRIYAADGTLLSYLHAGENRTLVSGEQIPTVVKQALVAIEDRRFYEHRGVDWEGVVRAIARNIEASEIEEGASSITQQLVGNLYLDRTDTSFERKFEEMALAVQMEEKMSKDEILNQYLNTVFFGSSAYGIMSAARTYFDKDPADLTLPEAALLVGLPQAPSAYSPRRNPESALNRRNQVLLAMYSVGYISYDEYRRAKEAPLELAPRSPYTRVQEPYVVAYVRRQLIEMFGEKTVFEGGLYVETTIVPRYQEMATQAISSTLDRPDDPSAAIVAIETDTGHIKAMVGGTDYDTSKFNLAAQGRRQPGSAFKTFALTAAIEMGMNPYTTYYTSRPLSLDIPGSTKPWRVRTFSHNYYGSSQLVQATLRSDNTVFAQLGMDVTPERIVDVAQRMGIASPLQPNPAITLGGLTRGVSPLEMASAYGTLADLGRHVPPTAILSVKNSKGEVIWQADQTHTQGISEGVAYEVTRILERNIQAGTGTGAQLDRPAAGKTGTAQDFRDAWFCGYIPQISTSVWVGHPEAQVEMRNVHGRRVTGGSFPATIWRKFMSQMVADYPVQDFPRPQTYVSWESELETDFTNETQTGSSSTTSSSTSTTMAPPYTGPPTTGEPGTTTQTTRPPTTQAPTTATTKPPTTETTKAPTTSPPAPPPTSSPTEPVPPTNR